VRNTWVRMVTGIGLLFGINSGTVRAEEEGVFQACCFRCRKPAVVRYYAPWPCCGPIRRLLGLCCPAPVVACRPCCPPAVVTPPPVFSPPPAPSHPVSPVPGASGFRGESAPPPVAPPTTGSAWRREEQRPPTPPLRFERLASSSGGATSREIPVRLASEKSR
jgi:hypothetical protein